MSNSRRQKYGVGIPGLYFIILLFGCSNVLRFAVSGCFFAVTLYSLRLTLHGLPAAAKIDNSGTIIVWYRGNPYGPESRLAMTIIARSRKDSDG